MDILERAYALEADSYDELPLWLLLGRAWFEDDRLRESYRALKRQGLLVEGTAPGFVRLA